MKNLIFTKSTVSPAWWLLAAAISLGGTPHSGAVDAETIRTLGGGVYRQVEILEADRHGLLFRHAAGIAKLPYAELPDNLRLRHEPTGGTAASEPAPSGMGVGEGFSQEGGTPLEKGKGGAKVEGTNEGEDRASAVIELRVASRVRWQGAAVPVWRDRPCWPSHWPRRSLPPHADFFPTPLNRAFALDELLRAGGLAGAAAPWLHGWPR